MNYAYARYVLRVFAPNINGLGKDLFFLPFLERGWGRDLCSATSILLFYLWPCACLTNFRSRLFHAFGPPSIRKKPNGRAPLTHGTGEGRRPLFSGLAHLFGSDGRKTGFPLPCLFINNKRSFFILPCSPSFGPMRRLFQGMKEDLFYIYHNTHSYTLPSADSIVKVKNISASSI